MGILRSIPKYALGRSSNLRFCVQTTLIKGPQTLTLNPTLIKGLNLNPTRIKGHIPWFRDPNPKRRNPKPLGD